MANPAVGAHVLASIQAAERLGLPEARIPLANAVVEMCLSEKSNSAYKAIDAAIASIHAGKVGDIPNHLRDTHYAGAAALGHKGYLYPHNTPIGSFGGWVNQTYLPDNLIGTKFYEPVLAGEEKKLAGIYQKLESFKQKKT
jgi:putative ATPase